jgi:2'-5' RNA ligase
MFRLFVAIELPPDIRGRLAGLCSGLPGAKWVGPEALHLTIRFIGEVDGALADDIHDALSRIDAPGFDLVVGGVDCFEASGKVHTLWTGVEKQPLLLHLREKVESALVRAGCPPERRKFKAHITLARFRGGAGERVGSYIQQFSRFATPPFAVAHFTLFRSHLGANGPHYEALARYPLKDAGTSATALLGSRSGFVM